MRLTCDQAFLFLFGIEEGKRKRGKKLRLINLLNEIPTARPPPNLNKLGRGLSVIL